MSKEAIDRLFDLIANSIGNSFIRVPIHMLPLADCKSCAYSKLPTDGGHCYMFRDKPGERCGQFTKELP